MQLRLQKLRRLLKKNHLDAMFVSSLPNITYLTNFSGFGTEDRDAFLLITKSKQYIFTHGIYKEIVEKSVNHFQLIGIQRENPISTALKTIIDKEKINKLGFEAFDLHVNEYNRLATKIDKKILQPIDLVGKLRMIKTPDEIQKIQKACELGDKAYSHILKNMRISMTEKEVAFALEMFIKKHGADLSFPTIVAFGSNASKPHHVPTDTKLKPNNLVLIDFGVRLNDYCSDMTRTFCFGKANEKQKLVYQTVFDAQQEAINKIKSSIYPKSLIRTKEFDKVAREYIVPHGFPNIPHSLGHGIGLEVHEFPRLTILSEEQLEDGMVFSIEPGIYLPDEMGVRIEDLFVIEKNKLRQLTNAPKRLIEI